MRWLKFLYTDEYINSVVQSCCSGQLPTFLIAFPLAIFLFIIPDREISFSTFDFHSVIYSWKHMLHNLQNLKPRNVLMLVLTTNAVTTIHLNTVNNTQAFQLNLEVGKEDKICLFTSNFGLVISNEGMIVEEGYPYPFEWKVVFIYHNFSPLNFRVILW